MHMIYLVYVMSGMQGGAQLAADVEYFCNVMSALQVSQVTCCAPSLIIANRCACAACTPFAEE
jgi:hypothetical protein